jgi:hypothetical protein
MLERNNYLNEINFLSLQELEKVKYLVFYDYRRSKQNIFRFSDITEMFSRLNLSKPNLTRLKTKIMGSREFISNHGETFSLHAQTIADLTLETNKIFKVKTKKESPYYVNLDRITELKKIKTIKSQFDMSRLIKMLEELNDNFEGDNFLSVCMLLRAIMDHVPPIFKCATFSEIENNYAGSKSFKKAMKKLSESCRDIADMYLHVQIREKETLPNATQVDFTNLLDVLIAEIIRISPLSPEKTAV